MTTDVDKMGLDAGAEAEELLRRFHPLLLEAGFGAGIEQLDGVTIAFDLANPAVQAVLDELALKVRSVAETTRNEIRALVGRQAAEGWSLSELAAALRAHGEEMSVIRAKTIAATETAAAYSAGSLLAYEESGVVESVEWLTSDPCPICAPLDGKVVPLGKPFADGINHPPAHPNCRCAVAPIVKE